MFDSFSDSDRNGRPFDDDDFDDELEDICLFCGAYFVYGSDGCNTPGCFGNPDDFLDEYDDDDFWDEIEDEDEDDDCLP